MDQEGREVVEHSRRLLRIRLATCSRWLLTATVLSIRQIAFSKDGKRLVSASEDGVVVIWDTATMRPLHRWSAHSLQVNTMLFTPDGKRLVTAGEEGKVKVWDVQTGKQVRDIPVD